MTNESTQRARSVASFSPNFYDLFHSKRKHIRGDELKRLIFLLSGTYE